MTLDYFIKGLTPRDYQINLFREAIERNVLIVLPTGMGKTLVAAMVASNVLNDSKEKVLMLAPTKPLVKQHYRTMKDLLDLKENEIYQLTGDLLPEDRAYRWVLGKVLVSTPQVAWNDIKKDILDVSKFGLVIFDEAHRAVGNYAYVGVSKTYREFRKHLILGLTASPGSDRSKFSDVMEVLGIEKVIIKSEDDPDVKDYVNEVEVKVTRIPLPHEVAGVSRYLRLILNDITEKLRKSNVVPIKNPSRKMLAERVKALVARAKRGEKQLFGLIPYLTAAIRVDYAIEYLETQGVEIFQEYIKQILESDDKSQQRTASIIRKSEHFQKLTEEMEKLDSFEVTNPKMEKAMEICEKILSENDSSNVIVFTHFRKTSELLSRYLSDHSTVIRPARFVGQSSKEGDQGLNRKEQESVMQKFRSGEYNVLVATSVAEEGIDVPSTDAVIFYEPVPSDIRSIQRRGRTGRIRKGEVHILTYEGTRDIGYLYTSGRKEKAMKRNISGFAKKKTKKKKSLYDF